MSKSIFSVLSAEGLVVSDESGIDWDSTLTAIRERVETEVSESAETDKSIVSALHEVFDTLPKGTHIPRNLAVNLALGKMGIGADITAMTVMTAKVEEYLDRSTVFTGKRGRGGGLGRA